MSRRHHRLRIQSRLRIIVLSILMTVLVSELAFFQFAPEKRVPTGISASLAVPNIGVPATFTYYSTVITSDLFSETRQPSVKVLARLATPTVEEASALRVIAIVTSGDSRLALVELRGSDQPQRLHVGDLIGTHRVTAIGPDAITIDNNGLREDFAVQHKVALDQDPSNPAALPASGDGAPSAETSVPHASNQSDAEAAAKAFWESRTKDVPDPPPRNLGKPRPRG